MDNGSNDNWTKEDGWKECIQLGRRARGKGFDTPLIQENNAHSSAFLHFFGWQTCHDTTLWALYVLPTDQGICEDDCHNTSKLSFVVMQMTRSDNHFCKLRIESHGIRDKQALICCNADDKK